MIYKDSIVHSIISEYSCHPGYANVIWLIPHCYGVSSLRSRRVKIVLDDNYPFSCGNPYVRKVFQWNGLVFFSLSLCMNQTVALTGQTRQDGRYFAEDVLKCIFFNENVWISLKIPLKFVPRGPINNIPALVQIMAWRRPGDKPLSEPMLVFVPTHICITRPQWVKNGCGVVKRVPITKLPCQELMVINRY